MFEYQGTVWVSWKIAAKFSTIILILIKESRPIDNQYYKHTNTQLSFRHTPRKHTHKAISPRYARNWFISLLVGGGVFQWCGWMVVLVWTMRTIQSLLWELSSHPENFRNQPNKKGLASLLRSQKCYHHIPCVEKTKIPGDDPKGSSNILTPWHIKGITWKFHKKTQSNWNPAIRFWLGMLNRSQERGKNLGTR